MDSVMEKIIINADDYDDNDDTSESMMIMMTRQNLQLVVTIMIIYKLLFQSSVTASEVK